jgi:NAD(P)-dependent dehydrogenase (short-subunit alcohol dehydrogenase family)
VTDPTFRPGLFAGKVAVVTGGTSGLGAATARVLARLGAEVYAVGLGADPAMFDEPLIRVEELDVTDDAALTALFSRLERLDILVPAAGISMGERELEWEPFQRVVSIQLLAVYRTIQLARPLLAAGGGSVITISSMYAFFGGPIAAYRRRRVASCSSRSRSPRSMPPTASGSTRSPRAGSTHRCSRR